MSLRSNVGNDQGLPSRKKVISGFGQGDLVRLAVVILSVMFSGDLCLGQASGSSSKEISIPGASSRSGGKVGASLQTEGPGIELWFERAMGGRVGSRRVPVAYRFCNGDRVALKLTAQHDLFLLALVRDVAGSPLPRLSEAAGLHRFDEPSLSLDLETTWKLLFGRGPRAQALSSKDLINLPVGGAVVLGDKPQPREIVLVISRKPFDLSRDFDHKTRTFSRGRGAPPSSANGLHDRLREWSLNAAFSGVGAYSNESYVVGIDASSPAAVGVFLNHQPCERRMSMPNLAIR